jgi:hypothetical protein
MPKNVLVHHAHNLKHLVKVTWGFVAFVAVYVAILFWFKYVDIYHKEFSTEAR